MNLWIQLTFRSPFYAENVPQRIDIFTLKLLND